MIERTFVLADLEATNRFGRALGERLFPGAVVALQGPLGAGKTHLVRAIAEGLGIHDPRLVTSPTFVLLQEYPARLPIYHFDAYRLPSAEAFWDLGVEEQLAAQGVCLVEWADRVATCLPEDRLTIVLETTGPTARALRVQAVGERYESLLRTLALS